MNGIYSTQAAEASHPSTNYKCLTFTFFRRTICCFYENSVLAKTRHAPCPPHPKTHSASPVGDNTPPRIKQSEAPTSAGTPRDWRKRGERRPNKVKSSRHLPTTRSRKGHDRAANTLLLILQTYGTKGRVDSPVTPVSTGQGRSTWQLSCVFSTDCLLALRLPLLW